MEVYSLLLKCNMHFWQDMANKASCRECDFGYFQNQSGATNCSACSAGWTTTALGMSYCDICIPNDYYRNGTSNSCLSRGAKCNADTQYEDPASANRVRNCMVGTFD